MPLNFLKGYYPMHFAIITFVLLVFFLGQSPSQNLMPLPTFLSFLSFLVAIGVVFKFYKPKWPASPTPFRNNGWVHPGFIVILGWNTASDTSIAILQMFNLHPLMVSYNTQAYMAQGFTAVGGAIAMAWLIIYLFSRYFQPR